MAMVKSKKHTGVYQKILANGDISYYYNYKDLDGKKIWKLVGKKSNSYSERDAVNERRKALAEISTSSEPLYIRKQKLNGNTKIRELAKKYFDEKTDMKNHRDAYLKYMNRIEPVFGSKNVYNLKADDVEQFKKALIKRGYKPASINYYLAQLRAIINYAIAKDVIEIINPCTKVKLLTLDNARERILSEEEIELLLSTISHNKKAHLFVMVAIFTGARPKAVLNLKKKDIDMGYHRISFMQMKQNLKYSVVIHQRLQNILYEWIKDFKPDEYIFFRENPSINKKVHITYIAIKNQVHPTMNKLFNDGLEMNDRINRVSLYTLRHSFGSLLSARGANAFVIKSLMNHSRIETTDRYVKVANSVAKQYIDLLL